MEELPQNDVDRTTIATWMVPTAQLPALAHVLLTLYKPEKYDPAFSGQGLKTVYYDTTNLDLRKARIKGTSYCTLRIRTYLNTTGATQDAISAKTENEKSRANITPEEANAFQCSGIDPDNGLFPAFIAARLSSLTGEEILRPVAEVHTRRYAVEDAVTRFTLDTHVHTTAGKHLPYSVLEMKTKDDVNIPAEILALPMYPVRISKFIWSTEGC